MSYEVLARKWRPQKFKDVVGQDTVVETLQKALSSERIAHAYLFTGSRGIGKTTLARLMAKALCCEKGISSNPCGSCTHCTAITEGRAVDVIEIDGASHTGVDDIRELRQSTRFQPQACRFKVFIIDEVHMLSNNAFNALLKTLEEPPSHVKFIFATTEVHKIPVTILSRCQRYDFRRIDTTTIAARLRYVLGEEDFQFTEDALLLIAKAAQGGMRDALSLTDQVLSFAGNNASAEQVRDALGMIDRSSIVSLSQTILERKSFESLRSVQNLYAGGYDLGQCSELLATEFRHLSISKSVGSIEGFADLSPDEIIDIDARAKNQNSKDLQRLLQASLDGIQQISASPLPKLTF